MNIYSNILQLDLDKRKEYYQDAVKLNTGRNCLEYVLLAKSIKKIYLPYYICDTILEPLLRNKIDYEYYSINSAFYPIEIKPVKRDEAFLYVNYFGINDKVVKYLSDHVSNLIIDNTQAFFSNPLPNIDTFYSPRKFFGVPDGGYLYTDRKLNCQFSQDISYKRMVHLIKLLDSDVKIQKNFHSDESGLSNLPIMIMSSLTQSLLSAIDYKRAEAKRKRNFSIFNELLSSKNEIHLSLKKQIPASYYPFLSTVEGLRQKLRENKIFTPTFWPNVLKRIRQGCFERTMVKNLVLLPVDQQKDIQIPELICDIILKLS